MVARDNDSQRLRRALWDELHYSGSSTANEKRQGHFLEGDDEVNGYQSSDRESSIVSSRAMSYGFLAPRRPASFYPDIDLSVPDTVYSPDGSVDLVWDLLRWEAFQQAQREPLLVSYLHSTILNHPSLESSLAFLLANRLQSPGMIATQLQSVISDALLHSPTFRRNLRADMLAVRDRDPACTCLPDVFLYFKGFHALQSHRVAHYLYREASPPSQRKVVLAKFLQSQVSQSFQIDIHPNAALGSGIMLDHGTGIVIGETANVGHNCSILHHVTLGGSGKKGVKRHPTVGDGVLLGAGATVLGDIIIGANCVLANLSRRYELATKLFPVLFCCCCRRGDADRRGDSRDLGPARSLRRGGSPGPNHRKLRRRNAAAVGRDGPDDLAQKPHHVRIGGDLESPRDVCS
jgi:serine O-acetyltransferase